MKKSPKTAYVTGRGIAALLTGAGWILVAVGVLAILSGLFFASFLAIGGVEYAGLLGRLFLALPGLFAIVAGLGAVLYAQTARATFDTAQHIRGALQGAASTGAAVPVAGKSASLRAEPPTLRRPATPPLRP